MLGPEEHGGGSLVGEGLLDLMIVGEEMGHLVTPGPLLSTNVRAAAITERGTPELPLTLWPGIASGETLATVRCTRNRPPTAPTSFSAMSPPFGPLTSEGTQTIVSATPERSALWDGSNRLSSRAETR